MERFPSLVQSVEDEPWQTKRPKEEKVFVDSYATTNILIKATFVLILTFVSFADFSVGLRMPPVFECKLF